MCVRERFGAMGTRLRSWLGPWCVECFSISLHSRSSSVHSDCSLLQRSGIHTRTNKPVQTHTRHAHRQIGCCAEVQAVTRRWTDAGVTISIGLSVGNNTLAGFSHETALTREATLKWSIHYLQITPCSGVCVSACLCLWVHILPLHVRECCRGAVGWCQCHHQLWDKMFSPKVTSSSLFSFLSCYNEAAIQNTMQTSMLEHLLQSLGCFVFPLFYGLFRLLVYFGLPQSC